MSATNARSELQPESLVGKRQDRVSPLPCPSIRPKQFWTYPNSFGQVQNNYDGSEIILGAIQ